MFHHSVQHVKIHLSVSTFALVFPKQRLGPAWQASLTYLWSSGWWELCPFLLLEISCTCCSEGSVARLLPSLGRQRLVFPIYCRPSCPSSALETHALLMSEVLCDAVCYWIFCYLGFFIWQNNWSDVDASKRGGKYIISFIGVKGTLTTTHRKWCLLQWYAVLPTVGNFWLLPAVPK